MAQRRTRRAADSSEDSARARHKQNRGRLAGETVAGEQRRDSSATQAPREAESAIMRGGARSGAASVRVQPGGKVRRRWYRRDTRVAAGRCSRINVMRPGRDQSSCAREDGHGRLRRLAPAPTKQPWWMRAWPAFFWVGERVLSAIPIGYSMKREGGASDLLGSCRSTLILTDTPAYRSVILPLAIPCHTTSVILCPDPLSCSTTMAMMPTTQRRGNKHREAHKSIRAANAVGVAQPPATPQQLSPSPSPPFLLGVLQPQVPSGIGRDGPARSAAWCSPRSMLQH